MHIIFSDFKNGVVKVKVTTKDDLWYLSTLIEKGDLLTGITERKIKLGSDQTKVQKRTFLVTIRAEKIEFSKTTTELRINGLITEAPEDIPKGIHQTIEIQEQSIITLRKEEWLTYQQEKIKESTTNARTNILVVVFDRESVIFAMLKQYGYEVILSLEGDVPKKGDDIQKESEFFTQIINQIKIYTERDVITKIVLASPAFWKEDLLNKIKDRTIKEKIISVSCGSASTNAIEEILKSDEIKKALLNERVAKEMRFVEELFKQIALNGLSAYGFKETKESIESGNISKMLVTDKYIQKKREENDFANLDTLMRLADAQRAEIHVISSDHEGGRRLDGLGGVGALLRYKKY